MRNLGRHSAGKWVDRGGSALPRRGPFMINMLRAIPRNAGILHPHMAPAIHGWNRFVRDRQALRKAQATSVLRWGADLPILTEWDETSGSLVAYFFPGLVRGTMDS